MKATRHISVSLLLLLIIALSACNSSKQVAYFQDVPDTVGIKKVVPTTQYEELIIKKGDVLNVDITTIDAKIGGDISTEMEDNKQTGSGQSPISGYTVDKDGFIEIPIVGRVKVGGLTTQQARELILQKASVFYKQPLVNVRIANFVVTIHGQVRQPGRYVVATEKLSIMDAIGLAGDLDIGGKRDNVMVIREEDGKTLFTRVNLNSTKLFQSEYYYLQSGDRIYVEPLETVSRAGTRDQRGDRILSISLGLVSIAIAVTSIILRINQ